MKTAFYFFISLLLILLKDATAQAPFLNYYSGSGNADVSFSAITTDGTNFFAIGNEGNKILIVELDASGQILSNRTMMLISEEKTPVCRSASFDPNGDLEICGYRGLIGQLSTYEGFVLDYDYSNDTILWLRTIASTGSQGSAFNKIGQVIHYPTNEAVCGYTSEPGKNQEATWWGIDASTGFLLQNDKLNIGSGNEEFTSFSGLNSPYGKQIVAGTFDYSENGNSKLRPVACRYGPIHLDQNKGFLKDTFSTAQLYLNDIASNKYGGMTAICSGDGLGTEENKDLFYFKFSGTQTFSNHTTIKVEFTNSEFDGKLLGLRVNSTSEPRTIIYGNKNDPSSDNHLGDAFLIGINQHNEFAWAKSYPFTCHEDGRGVDAMLLNGENVWVVGRAFDEASGHWMGAILNVDVASGSLPNCETDEDVELLNEPDVKMDLKPDEVPRSDHISSGKVTVDESDITSSEVCSGLKEQTEAAEAISRDAFWIYPNPTVASATITFSLPEKSNVSIKIYTATGQEVKNIFSDELDAGIHQVMIDCRQLNRGIYIVKVKSNDQAIEQKLIIE